MLEERAREVLAPVLRLTPLSSFQACLAKSLTSTGRDPIETCGRD